MLTTIFFCLGYIIITSIYAKIQWLKLAGYCPWTILFNKVLYFIQTLYFLFLHIGRKQNLRYSYSLDHENDVLAIKDI